MPDEEKQAGETVREKGSGENTDGSTIGGAVDPRDFYPTRLRRVNRIDASAVGMLTDNVTEKRIGKVINVDEQSAANIALIITCTFAACSGLLLVGLYLILRRAPDDAKTLLEAAVPVLKESGTFLSTVFGPLLGFVLGYYFRERKDKS